MSELPGVKIYDFHGLAGIYLCGKKAMEIIVEGLQRPIREIIIHCSATPEGKDFTVEQIRNWHVKGNGWADIGYHYIVYRDGSVHAGRPLRLAGAHTTGHNACSIGICYVGGLRADGSGRPKDTRTPAQRAALVALVKELKRLFPQARVCGHNEFAAKACPSFCVKTDPELGML